MHKIPAFSPITRVNRLVGRNWADGLSNLATLYLHQLHKTYKGRLPSVRDISSRAQRSPIMPLEPQKPPSSSTHASPLRSHSRKHQDASAPKAVPATGHAQPSLSPRKDTKDLNKKYQMANQSAKMPSQAPQRASYPPATREAQSQPLPQPQSTSNAAVAKQHSAAKRTVQSVMAGKEPPPPSLPLEPPQQPSEQENRPASASYLLKLGVLLNIEALFKTSPDEVVDLMADIGRTYPDLLESAGLRRVDARRG